MTNPSHLAESDEGWEFGDNSDKHHFDNSEESVESDIKSAGVVYRGPRDERSFLPVLENQLLPVRCEDEFIRKYHPGSLVWAKVAGHPDPAWPAKITKVRENKGLDLVYRVTFYRTNEFAELREMELFPYSENSEETFVRVNIVNGGERKRKMFEDAVHDIRSEFEFSPNKVPCKQAVLSRQSKYIPVEISVLNPPNVKHRDRNMNIKKGIK